MRCTPKWGVAKKVKKTQVVEDLEPLQKKEEEVIHDALEPIQDGNDLSKIMDEEGWTKDRSSLWRARSGENLEAIGSSQNTLVF